MTVHAPTPRGRLRVAALLAALLLVACGGQIPGLYPPSDPAECRTIRLVRHALHLGILVPAEAVDHPVAAHFPDARHIEFGWGDRRYYMADDASTGLALRAVLLPTDSVMHVVGYTEPLRPGGRGATDVIEIGVSQAGLANMMRAILEDFAPGPAGELTALGPGLYGDSRFFAADRTYHLFSSSNSWSASKLHQAGFPIVPPFPLTADDVLAHVRAQQPAPCPADAAP